MVRRYFQVGLIMIFVTLLSAVPTEAQQKEPITLYAPGREIYSMDPQLVFDTSSLEVIENLFLGLTDVDPRTTQLRPEIALDWSTNQAGDVWTFNLRTDIPWVQWNPVTKQATELRKVVATDFEYAIKRACDPRLEAPYISVVAKLIKGCDVVAALEPSQITSGDFEQIAVRALSDSQLQITTQGILPYFLSTSSMAMFRAVPREIVEAYGSAWTTAGLTVTNGPYLLDEDNPNVRRVFVKNPLYPPDVNDNYGGNIERIIFKLGCNNCAYFEEYLRNEVDVTPVGGDLLDVVRADPELSEQYRQRKKLSVEYFVFNYDKPPFDNVHVRRAFSMAIDRGSFTRDFLKGTSLPIDHFAPPGTAGALPPGTVLVGTPENPGFDPQSARQELAAAGYADCEGFPPVTIFVAAEYQGELVRQSAIDYLGCAPDVLNQITVDYGALAQLTGPDIPNDQRPNMFAFSWGADYPDAHNFLHDVLGCTMINASHRPCGSLDTLIDNAGQELSYQRRVKMYADLEKALFGQEGEFPIAPVRIPTVPLLTKPWYKGFFETDGLFAEIHWNTYTIDQDMQMRFRIKPDV